MILSLLLRSVGMKLYEIGFDANKIIQHKYFQKLLKVPQLNKLLRQGDVIPSLPKRLFPTPAILFSVYAATIDCSGSDSGRADCISTQLAATYLYRLGQLKALRQQD